ncbi:MAG: glycosyltransferase family 39 protein [Acidobacteria bacterium]|nr:glycosyltransferase family 39 protein [Acidobacteriota bacterium]
MLSPLKRDLLILFALAVLVRLPFLDEAVQGDDVYYLLIAENARVDPWHPMQMGFRLQGETVWAAGHTRPPGNAYLLAGLLSVFGGMRETAFHAVYALFSVAALWGCYFLARRFTDQPLVAALCVAAAPAFLVNGNKLESDLPMLALLSVGAALLVHRRFGLAALALAAGCFFGYQAVFLLPIFAAWVWLEARRNPRAWLALAIGPALLVAWQLYERAAAGTAPAQALAGYFSSYGLLALERKLRSVRALQAHLGLMVAPLLAFAALWRRSRPELAVGLAAGVVQALLLTDYTPTERLLFAATAGAGVAFLLYCVRNLARLRATAAAIPAIWALVFFSAAMAVFYAGSARYLLPLAPAVGILVANWRLERPWLIAGLGLNFAVGVSLAWVEHGQANAYRDIAAQVASLSQGRRVYSNAEWGLRYYLGELAGSEPLLGNQIAPSGSLIVQSALAAAIPYQVEGVRRHALR